jgi:hypothetical protein
LKGRLSNGVILGFSSEIANHGMNMNIHVLSASQNQGH